MTVNSYLQTLATSAFVRDEERFAIDRSIASLQSKLDNHFGKEIGRHLIFGSYSRGTILPRTMDEHSDVDYMIVFKDDSYAPQTYLKWLRDFASQRYVQSEIFQSSPTIVLSLNHISFELVPATDNSFYGLHIPAKSSSYSNWQSTDPTGFNNSLTSANSQHNNLIKPLVRLVKYWNAKNSYIFESYELEKAVVARGYFFFNALEKTLLKSYFYSFMESLECSMFDSKLKREKIDRAKQLIRDIKEQERIGNQENAEKLMQRLLPHPQESLLRALRQ